MISDQLGASHLSSHNRQWVPKRITLEIPIAWSTLEALFLAQPMSSSAAFLRFVPTGDGSEAGLAAAPCIHTMPRGHQIKVRAKASHMH